ncbi:MAG: sigma-54-dependent Fis family transcriptional regulator [Phycisphaerales bacterium]|nr:sigma-54-dependent Fis family transcriptional regulator [Phycisphaerales bacterium]
MAKVFVVEDELVLAKNVCDKLRAHGHKAEMRHNCADALAAVASIIPDVILLDIRLPDGDGLELLPKLREEAPSASVIVMTAHGNERIAVDAMKAGAFEYLTKPVDLDELKLVVDRAVDQGRVADNLDFLRRREENTSGLDRILGDSPAINQIKETITRLTRTNVLALPDPPTVLITGETGTGKDVAARALHYDGPRRKKPFIQVNCTALPATLFESELFGHVKGAFTSATGSKRGLFEVAEGGTIFLDEIGHLDLEMQAKLLHAIEHREIRPVGATELRPINVHIVAATNRDLAAAVEKDEFRRDLYHRLRVVQLHLPPLRARGDDILLLARHFLARHCDRFGMGQKRFGSEALDRMRSHAWRGNVRELSHVVESAILHADGDEIGAARLPLSNEAAADIGDELDDYHMSIGVGDDRFVRLNFDGECPSLDEIEHIILSAAYEHTGGNLSRAARILGITREALRYRLNRAAEKAQ